MSQTALAYNTASYSIEEPENVEDALKHKHWRKTVQEEINALQKNGT